MLLTAPRAGYGKTHLLGRIAQEVEEQAVIVPITFRAGDALSLPSLSRRGLDALLEAAPGDSPGWSRLRHHCAQVVTKLVRKLVAEGRLTCANPQQALEVLSGPQRDIFDPDGKARRVGDWLAEHQEGLCASLAALAARQLPLRAELLHGWMCAMMSQCQEGGLAGVAEMRELCTADQDHGVPAFLALLDLWRPVVVLVDHLDGLYRNPEAGVKIASMMLDLVENQKMHVVLSLNQDVWQATFGHHLPGALEDRLTASQVLLRGLNEADATSLLRLRLDQAGVAADLKADFEKFLNLRQHFLGRPVGSVSARAFLRHCARQWEIYHHIPASEVHEPTGEHSAGLENEVPLLTETVADESLTHLPPLFDQDTANVVQRMADSLAEPEAALPQDDVRENLPTVDPAPQESAEETLPPPALPTAAPPDAQEAAATDWKTVPGTAPANSSAEATPTADAFVKLRDMLSRLRQPSGMAAAAAIAASPAPSAQPLPTSTAPPLAKPTTPVVDELNGRFHALRLQHQAEAVAQPLDHARLAEVIRLAGRRFPLVRFSEHELPGLPGRQALYWTMQGVEVLFGTAPPSDTAYWQTMSAFAAGRLAELTAQAEREKRPPAKLKMVGFKTERDQLTWQGILQSQFFPPAVREVADIIHLDVESAAALYAMQRLIKESESGVLKAEPSQIISTLARELDFFWKRVTRLDRFST
ncbi:MAG: hypothetical protein LDL31_01225 [Prosthecobacter sp.]|jgi:hypothetical protein|nr:hypothetical protein [Prosthecobacter sp.]